MADVLIIDDDPDSADVLASVMQAQGHEVRVGYDGQEGMNLVDARRPDLVLLDVEMPVLTGPGMAHRMFVHDMGLEMIPIILLSGVHNLTEVAAQVGTPYYLLKPYPLAKLVALLKRVLVERVAPSPPGLQPLHA
ncbi:MAG: response regulator [Deltaproteobacteria bacterium]|nr:response regulator [Deltaproteobacteria bacterium]MCW5806932.1 response regulator [Deltaproteobacteria bacterium]